MWIFLNDAFLSIVADRDHPDNLMVRARSPGDIERAFPSADVSVTPLADYRFRASLSRVYVEACLAARVRQIRYDNFKLSVPPGDFERWQAYSRVWCEMLALQNTEIYP